MGGEGTVQDGRAERMAGDHLPPVLHLFHQVEADQAEAVIEQMGQDKSEQDQPGAKPEIIHDGIEVKLAFGLFGNKGVAGHGDDCGLNGLLHLGQGFEPFPVGALFQEFGIVQPLRLGIFAVEQINRVIADGENPRIAAQIFAN